jgi:hypothetical protein
MRNPKYQFSFVLIGIFFAGIFFDRLIILGDFFALLGFLFCIAYSKINFVLLKYLWRKD